MNDLTFKRRLIDFFERHDKSNLGLVDQITKNYNGKEEQAFEVLNKFYTGKKSGVSREMVEKELNISSPIMSHNVGREK